MRRADDRGVALLEAAIIMPVLVLLVFGVFDLGFAWRSGALVDGSTRSGVRVAAATYGGAGDDTERSVVLDTVRLAVESDLEQLSSATDPVSLWIYSANADGDPLSTTCAAQCVRYSWNGTEFSSPAGSWANADACGSSVDYIGVRVTAEHGYITKAIGASINITRSATMRLEPISEEECVA